MKNILTFSRRVIPIMAIMLLSVYGAWGQDGKSQMKVASTTTRTFTETLGSDSQGCYWLITFKWECSPNSTNFSLGNLPVGIRLYLEGATINSTPAPTITGASPWTPSVSTVTSLPPGITAGIQWTQNPPSAIANNPTWETPCMTNYSSLPWMIPVNNLVTIKLYITPTGSPIKIIEQVLANPSTGFFSSLEQHQSATLNQPTATIVPLQSSICSGGATEIRLVPPMPPPARIQWYSYTPPNCGVSCPPPPATYPPAPGSQWSLVPTTTTTPQYGANQVATNKLFAPTCYVAHIDSGCFSYYSNVVRVNVCPAWNTASIAVKPNSDPLSPTNHSCGRWRGALQLFYDSACCNTKISWVLRVNGVYTMIVPDVNNINLNPFGNNSPFGNDCCVRYTFEASITNSCGTHTVSFDVVIDRPLTAADVTLKGNEADFPETAPTATPTLATLCYNRSAKIWVTRTCSPTAPCEGINILKWQQHNPSNPFTNGTPVNFQWADIPGADGTEKYNTNKLKNPDCGVRSVWYRVRVSNGTCPPIWSNPFEIKVKPELKVTLTPPSGQLCTNVPIILTAITCPPSNTLPNNAFKWFKDGVPLSGGGSSRTVNQAGNYSVTVTDVSCSSSAISNTVKICGRPVVSITGPCGICPGQSIILKTNNLTVPDGCTTLCNTYIWKRNGIVISPQPVPSNQLTVTQPGVYTVELDCGACKSSATHTVTNCPPSTPASCKCEPIPNRTIRFKAQIDGQTRQDSCGGNVKLPRSQEIIDVQAAFGCMDPQNGACATTYEWYVNGVLVPSATGSSFNTVNSGSVIMGLFNIPNSSFPVRVVIKCNGMVCIDCTVKVYIY